MFWLGFLIIILLLGYLYQTRNHGHWEKIGVPCAGGKHWFFGHFKDVLMSTKHTGEKFRDMYNEFPDSPCVGFLKVSTPGLLLRDPEYVKAVLSTDFSSFSKNEIFGFDRNNDLLFGNNPFVLDGEEWKVSRGHATPLSTLSKQRTYFPNMIQVADIMIDYIKHSCLAKGSVELELKKLSGMYTTDVVANAFLGVANNTFADPNSLFASLTKDIISGTLFENVKMIFSFLFPQFTPYLGIRFSTKRTEDILLPLVRKVIKDRTENGVTRNDVFQQMLMYRKNDLTGLITDEYIASHCFSFISDGYETSSDVICFALFELAWNEEVQAKLRNEIRDFLKETNGNYAVENVESLKYLNMVVSEALRLHPPALTIAKVATSDYTFPSKQGDIKIKKDCSLSIPIYALHLDPKYFPNPEKFDPERFTEESVSKRHKYVYIPFGEGPRKCLGQRSALLQVKLAILKIIEHFNLKPSPRSSYPALIDPKAFIKRPLNGAWVIFEPIKANA